MVYPETFTRFYAENICTSIPRDRIVDGVDQSRLFLKGDTHGRRDYVHLYEVDKLKATVKQNMKIHWPGPGVNPAMAKMFNLY